MDYRISGERLKGFADQARRLGKVGGELTPGQIEEVLAGVTGGVSLFDATVTDKIANHIVAPVNCTWEVGVEEYPTRKFSYNGVVLPEILPFTMEEYPYAWIRENHNTGYYDLILTAVAGYYDPDAGTSNGGIVYGANSAGTEVVKYRISIVDADNATGWEYLETSKTWMGLDSARVLLWSNHDILNGSANATEIYFEGNEPVLAE